MDVTKISGRQPIQSTCTYKMEHAHTLGLALMSAALALPSTRTANAESAPERGQISYKYMDYKESQPDQDRVRVRAPSVMLLVPIAGEWSVSGSYVLDTVSGASPAYHSEQITQLQDKRRAGDINVTRYFAHGTLGVGTSYSKESDYTSRSLSLQGSLSNENKNTTLNFGVGITDDSIHPDFGGIREDKNITDFMLGLTQVITRNDIAQLNLGYSHGRGYFTDPYKFFDQRPDERNHTTILTRWNHHFDRTDGTSHLNYRYYRDNWEITAHTLSAEYIQPLSRGWSITPSVRYHTQSAADFYLKADPALTPGPTIPAASFRHFSEDQRLSAFGAMTLGLKVSKHITPEWVADVKYEHYEQQEKWSLSGDGDSLIAPFQARNFQFGLTRFF